MNRQRENKFVPYGISIGIFHGVDCSGEIFVKGERDVRR